MQNVWTSGNDLQKKVTETLANQTLWGVDLLQFEGLADRVTEYISSIRTEGILVTIDNLEKQ